MRIVKAVLNFLGLVDPMPSYRYWIAIDEALRETIGDNAVEAIRGATYVQPNDYENISCVGLTAAINELASESSIPNMHAQFIRLVAEVDGYRVCVMSGPEGKVHLLVENDNGDLLRMLTHEIGSVGGSRWKELAPRC